MIIVGRESADGNGNTAAHCDNAVICIRLQDVLGRGLAVFSLGIDQCIGFAEAAILAHLATRVNEATNVSLSIQFGAETAREFAVGVKRDMLYDLV
jgi:hypothetical protein